MLQKKRTEFLQIRSVVFCLATLWLPFVVGVGGGLIRHFVTSIARGLEFRVISLTNKLIPGDFQHKMLHRQKFLVQ